ncbi:MAG TPA: ROK family protein [Pyrinomonadaceae bacterium]|nr:ROK family protein [Pyrinomonadaceae bacterium]
MPSKERKVVLAVDLGGTHLRAALIDDTGEILTQLKKETPEESSSDMVIRALVDAERECRANAAVACNEVIAASVMVPGTVDKAKAVVVQAPNLPCLYNFPLKQALENEFGRTVVLENDANAAAMGEAWLGAARGCRNIVCITLGTGVGGGVILDGRLWRGSDGSAGEIGHTTIEPFSGLYCKCGNEGCLEMFASARSIVRMASENLPRFPQSALHGQTITAKRIYELGLEGDELALAVFERMGTYLGIAVANLINLLNPEIIVIGGGVANGWSLFEGSMQKQIAARAFKSQLGKVRVVSAGCGDNAGLLGAARLAFDAIH